MRALLDTHTFLWFIESDARLSVAARRLVIDPENDAFLSIGSVWEMAIKYRLGKLQVPQPLTTFIPDQLRRNSVTLLDITLDHLAPLTTLPLHHRDPFDRLLIVQAMFEDIPIISADAVFDAYGVTRRW